ncbi:transmembrane emp24 domain-containing protein p24delta9-like [Nicotiana tomentosiformis]|uniref:transmembrane emp24 domain-containing protein p24delta9-like n=1 Tax=Nicotiana tomentosiformis TaxID=4098 RepID=UPI00051CA73C|nr:transmembrane emp24 domain-containing protein p24delta9-like [Nicotiana tomentosiformis]XP_033515832.1 transmembrane emp24 domain-containing protein p24delta9-like [Nicotiana tomentosiformis]
MIPTLPIILILMFLARQIQSVQFEVLSGHTKCIAEDIKSHSMTVGKYHIVNPNDGHPLPDTHKVTVRVTSTYGNTYHYSDNVPEGHFAFETTEAGDYMACFYAADHKPPITLTVDFDWKSGVAAKDWTSVAKKGSVELMELELKKMYEHVQNIHDEMFYLREREEEMQELNRSTNSKMAWMTGLSIFVCLSVAWLQLWHLKTFFEKKKLI